MTLLDLLYIPLAFVTAPWWAGKKRHGWPERMGKVEPLPASARPRVMLHAVSVGEVSALRELVPLLAADFDVLVTATTDTGLKRATELFAGVCHVRRYPIDASWCVERFLDATRPDVVALVELEVWPNFVSVCARRRIPMAIINGRLSERSFRGYRRIRWYFRRCLQRLQFVACQDRDYASRFLALGVHPDRCLVTGSMKWDSTKPQAGPVPGAKELGAELGIDPSKPLIVCGSTGPGEEALLVQAAPPGVQLLCAPRKPERFDEAAMAMGEGVVRRSKPGSGDPSQGRFLLDTIGELRKAYSLADVVVVGRSFCNLFGSDPIEPVALGKATVIGPDVSDFAAIVASLEGAGGLARATRATLSGVLGELIENPGARERLAAGGVRAVVEQQGASARHAALIRGLVERGASERKAAGAGLP